MLYPSVALMQAIADELDDRPAGFPAFARPVIQDAEIAARLSAAHALMEGRGDSLAVDEAFTAALSLMIGRHAGSDVSGRRIGREAVPIRRARPLPADKFMPQLTLKALPSSTRFTPF